MKLNHQNFTNIQNHAEPSQTHPNLPNLPSSCAGWDAQTVHLIRLKHNIEILEGDYPVDVLAPVETLDVSSLPDESLESLRRDMKIETPSPIQMQAGAPCSWRSAMDKR